MVNHCCVPKCSSTASPTSRLSFHSFPSDIHLRKSWLHCVKRDTRKTARNPKPFVIGKHTKVCSLHFKAEDFLLGTVRAKLVRNAVPSVLPWTSQQPTAIRRTSRCHNIVDVATTEQESGAVQEEVENSLTSLTDQEGDECSVEALPDNCPLANVIVDQEVEDVLSCQGGCKINTDLIIENYKLKEEINTLSEKLRANSEDSNRSRKLFGIDKFKLDDAKISYYTGFPSYAIFMLVFQFLLPHRSSGGVVLKGTNSNRNNQSRRKLSAEDEFFLFLVKLRQSFGYEHLAYLFGISSSTVCRKVTSWLSFCYLRLGSMSIWPHRDILIRNSLPRFREKYPNTLGSIDCTEIFINTPSSLVRQSQCYSSYKSNTTLKGLVAVDPNGGVIFVSQLWTGSISDRKIIIDSGFASEVKRLVDIGHINPGDIILADKGFKVADLLKPVHINLPAFRVANQQFEPDDVNECRRIAAERIHVERAIQRIKSFKILSGDIPVALLGSVNQIWTVCCILTNFRNPLINDDGEINDDNSYD